MEFLAVVELPTEETAEDAQAQGVGLADIGCCRQPEADLSQQNTSHNGRHQPDDHLDDIVSRTLPDGLVDKETTQPHHQQPEHHLPDTCDDVYRRIQADAPHVLPKPDCVSHRYEPSMTPISCHCLRISVTSFLASSAVTSNSSQSFSVSESMVKSPIA